MLRLTNKYKLYLYLFFFVFLTSVFNFKFLESYQKKFLLKNIYINGLSYNEKKNIEIELKNFLNTNIFEINKDKVLAKLSKFNYLEKIYVSKIIPTSINISLSKTAIMGKTIINGKSFYIGKNGKFINFSQLPLINNIATVFGEFQIDEYLELVNILETHNLNIDDIKKYYYYKNKRWDLQFSNNLTLMLPSKNIDTSIIIYKTLLKNDKLLNIKILDLRINNQIIITKKNE